MPYLAHFGLKDHPFTLTPNIDYYFPTQDNANIIASLDFALRRDSGIIKIVGEVGTGKTLLCRLLINKLVDNDKVAYINAPQADSRTIIRTVCEEFGIDPGPLDGSPYAGLNRFLLQTHEENKLAVVVVDEAQHLGRDGLEAIRLISNLETEKSKLLQIVLFGQTELDDLLSDPSLRQLAQRVVFSFNTQPLTAPEAKRYVSHRIRVSRREGVEYSIFSDAALEVIAKHSGGTPRVVNILADKSLLVAFSDGSPTVQKAHALEAVKDTPGLTVKTASTAAWLPGPRFGRVAAIAAGVLAIIAAGLYGGWRMAQRSSAEAPPVAAAAQPMAQAEPPAPAAAPPSAAQVQVAPAAPVQTSVLDTAPVPVAEAAPSPAPPPAQVPPQAPTPAPAPAPVAASTPPAAAPTPVAMAVPPPAKTTVPHRKHVVRHVVARPPAPTPPPEPPPTPAPTLAPAAMAPVVSGAPGTDPAPDAPHAQDGQNR